MREGSTVGIVAPGRKINSAEVETAVLMLTQWGLNVIQGTHLFSGKHSYFSGTDEERLEDFQTMIDDKNVDAIICARGGYGSTRIIDRINFTALKKNPKWIVGFSDITAIHLKLLTLNYQSIHGTMPVLFAQPTSLSSVQSLRKVLFGEPVMMSAEGNFKNRLGRASGETVGGNLSLVVDSLGTSSEIDTAGKILIIEEIDEYLYRIDRMLTQLKRADKLQKLAGLVIGHFSNIKDTELSFGERLEDIILHAVNDFEFPVAFGFPTGHENPNLAWRQGGEATLQVNEVISQLVSL